MIGGPFYEHEKSVGRYPQGAFFGECEDWRDTVLCATGESLDPKYFVETFRG